MIRFEAKHPKSGLGGSSDMRDLPYGNKPLRHKRLQFNRQRGIHPGFDPVRAGCALFPAVLSLMQQK